MKGQKTMNNNNKEGNMNQFSRKYCSSTEFHKNRVRIRNELAAGNSIIVEHNNVPDFVVISFDLYKRLEQYIDAKLI